MTTATFDFESEGWRAGPRTRSWLLWGMFALIVDGLLQAVGSLLELRFWNQDGLTPDLAVGFVAVLPQAVILAAFLALARDAESRGMWKSAAGLFVCGWLGLFVDLATYDELPPAMTTAVSVVGGIGVVGMFVFLLGKWPRFARAGTSDATRAEQYVSSSSSGIPETNVQRSGIESGDAEDAKAADMNSTEKAEEGSGCVGHLILGGILVGVRVLAKMNKQWFWWLPDDASGWALFELIAVYGLAIWFGLWFAAVKIRLRHKLGAMSAVLGLTEILVSALMFTVIGVVLAALFMTVVGDPNIDEAAMNQKFDRWAPTMIVLSGACYLSWTVVAVLFLASVRHRSEPDWRIEFKEGRFS